MKATVQPGALNGSIIVPGSKSHTIRALIIATLAGGRSVIRNPLLSEDCKAAMRAAIQFGSTCQVREDCWVIEGPPNGLKTPDNVVDVANSGTTLYFMTSVAALLSDAVVFTGDASIRRRPSEPLLAALRQLGVEAFTTRRDSAAALFVVRGPMRAGKATVSGLTSQWTSSILIAAPLCKGRTRIELPEPRETPYIEMTIDWMRKSGVTVAYDERNFNWFEVEGVQEYRPFERDIPSDWSSVAFPLVAALGEGSRVRIDNLDFNDKQGDMKIVDYLLKMGADIERDERNGSLTVRGGKPLHGAAFDMLATPDALPILSVAACFAKGVTVLHNVSGTRRKETDRVAVMSDALNRMGADISYDDNTMTIRGGRPLSGCELESHDDHRVAMALTAAALSAKGETVIRGAECAGVTFPGFFDKFARMGARIRTADE